MLHLGILGAGACAAPWVRAETFLSISEAQQLIFPGRAFEPFDLHLEDVQVKAIKARSGMSVHQRKPRLWKGSLGDWFWLDQVIGKHEFIDLAVGIAADGSIQGIEILTYRESYGSEVRNEKWRQQFRGKTSLAVPMKLDQQIHNISGATLSCRHLTDAANRWLATWELVLKHL
jgi:hypothetical protein